MELLVVVGGAEVPTRVREKAVHVIHTDAHGMGPELVAHVRAHSPRVVGVVGSAETAIALRDAGFGVIYHSDDGPLEGVETVRLTDQGEPMDVADSLLDLTGNTPMVRLDRMARRIRPHLLAKLEMLNPGGSVKDRPAVTMIDEAERQGWLKPGGTIVEPTSGNTGVGLAIVAARRHYKCVFIVPNKVSAEKINLLRAYGAEVVVCPTAVAPEHPESYYSVSDRLAREIPGAYKPNQYENPANPLAHVRTTGPEIWEQTKGRITHFVAGVGTAGTIVGTAKYLKEKNPNIQIIGADPVGSVYSGGTGRPYLVEGVGEDFFPGNYDASIIDRVIAVSDRDSFNTARRLTKEEGILTGGSSGMALHAALQLGEELDHNAVVVVLLPDSGRGYVSKFYSDSWMADYGFLRAQGPSAADVLAAKDASIPEIVHVHPHETVRDVVSIMREFDVSQVLVVNAEPPLVMGEVAGSVNEDDLLHATVANPVMLDQPIGGHTGPVPPTIGTGESVNEIIGRLESSRALLVVDAGHPIGILTRSDLLQYLAR
jgi:cystathionine beta-synthase